jgi:predicted TIM-barrel fold metal-dependent hydrolase
MVDVVGIDRVIFTADYPYGNMTAARQFLDHLPINPAEDRRKVTAQT